MEIACNCTYLKKKLIFSVYTNNVSTAKLLTRTSVLKRQNKAALEVNLLSRKRGKMLHKEKKKLK